MTPVDEKFAGAIAAEYFGAVASARALPGEFDLNFALTTPTGEGYILKFSHPQTSDTQIDFENALMTRLAHLAVPHLVPSVTGAQVVRLESGARVRMLTRLPGRMLVDVHPKPTPLLVEIGRLLGQVDRALQDFSHPGMTREWMWDLTRAPEMIRMNLGAVSQADLPPVTHFLERFERFVRPVLGSLPGQVIHNDANDHNVLVGADGHVTGLVDFGDSLFAPRVCEAAIAGAYLVLGNPDLQKPAIALVRGYHAANPLQPEEIDVFWDLVGARLAVSIAVASGRAAEQSGNAYHQVTSRAASAALTLLAEHDPAALTAALHVSVA